MIYIHISKILSTELNKTDTYLSQRSWILLAGIHKTLNARCTLYATIAMILHP